MADLAVDEAKTQMEGDEHLHWGPAHATPAARRVPVWMKVGYGMGGLTDYFYLNFPLALAMPIYAISMKMDPALLGIALAIPKVVGAVLDPLIGNMSDNHRGRWGRRKPFILAGGIVGSMLLPLMWFVPHGSEWVRFAYVAGMISLICVFYSIFSIPYGALGYELSTDYDERTRVLAWRGYVQLFGIFSAAWFYRACRAKSLFSDEVIGARWLSVLIGTIMVAGAIVAALTTREATARRQQRQVPIAILPALRLTLANRPFLLLEAALLLMALGLGCTSALGTYVHFNYMAQGDRTLAGNISAWGGTLTTFTAFLGMPLGLWISRHMGKREGAIVGTGMTLVSVLILPVVLSPTYRWLVILSWLIAAMGQQCAALMFGSMTADICDEDELATGHRREGAYTAVNGVLNKVMQLAMLLGGGFLPRLVGYADYSIDPTAGQLLKMKYLLIGLQLTGVTAALVLLWFYPITRARSEEIRRQLDRRKPAAAPV